MPRKNKREEVMQAALELIAEHGLHNTTTALITQKAGVGMGTIYNHFQGKEELFETVYLERMQIVKEEVLSDYDTTSSLQVRYLKLCRNLFDYLIKNPMDYRLFEQYRHTPIGTSVQLKGLHAFQKGELSDNYPFLKLFKEGLEEKVLKNLQLPLFFALTLGPLFSLAGDWISGSLVVDGEEIDEAFLACWDAIAR